MEDIKIIRGFLSNEEASNAFNYLKKNIDWKDKLNVIDSVDTVKINRKMAYVTFEVTDYKYANFYFKGETWNEVLSDLRRKLEKELNVEFNSILLNYYKDGKDEIKWHSDKEESLGENPIIACINLGATRKFWFRKKETGSEKFFHEVSNGDLLIMGENCQKNYLHAILKEKDVIDTRISLTFRYNH